MVAVSLQRYMRRWGVGTTTSYCDICLFFITAPSSLFPRHLIRSDYRVIAIYTTAACGTLCHFGHGLGAKHDRVRSHCNGTRKVVRQVSRQYIEAEIACSSSRGHRRCLPLLTDSCTWRRRDDEFRKTFVFYRAACNAAAVWRGDFCPSVCPSVRLSVCPSHAWIVTKR